MWSTNILKFQTRPDTVSNIEGNLMLSNQKIAVKLGLALSLIMTYSIAPPRRLCLLHHTSLKNLTVLYIKNEFHRANSKPTHSKTPSKLPSS